jgi:hypothetical protein
MRALSLATSLVWLWTLGPAWAKPATKPATRPGSPRLVKKLELTTDRDFRLLSPGRYVQIREERERAAEPLAALDFLVPTVLDLARLEPIRLRVDLRPLVTERADILLDGEATWSHKAGTRFPTFQVKLVAYDPERGRSGLLVRNTPPDGPDGSFRRRHLYLPWEPAANTLGEAVLLSEAQGGRDESDEKYFVELGLDPTGRHLYFLTLEKLPAEEPDLAAGRLVALRLDLDARRVDWRYTFETGPSQSKKVFSSYRSALSPDGSLLLLAEYSEADDEPGVRAPVVHVVDVAARSHFSLPILHTPYGLVVDEKNHFLTVANSQDRKLVLYDLQKRVKLREAPAPGRVHQAALTRDGQAVLLWPRGRTLELRGLPSLKRTASLEVARITPGSPALDAERTLLTLDRRHALVPPSDQYGFGQEEGLYVLELP